MSDALVVAVRGVIAFCTLLIFARVLGKQQISQLTFFDYILGITIGSTASSLTTDLTSRAWPHWIGLLVWTLAVLITQVVTLKWRYSSKCVDGEPTIVVMDGKIMEAAMKKMRYRMDDLRIQLRHNQIFNVMEVKYAILETDGTISVMKKPEFQSPTIKDMNLPLPTNDLATELIYDGVIIDQNLKQFNHDRIWLDRELQKLNIKSPKEVFYMTLSPDGTLYTDKYEDHVEKITDISDYNGLY